MTSQHTTARWLAAAFILYGLVATAFLAINVPPFQSADEATHFMRAAQVAEGRMIGNRFSTIDNGVPINSAGGTGSAAILEAWAAFSALPFHPETRATRSMWVPRITWSGPRRLLSFPNSAIDPPVFYFPAAIGVLIGRASRMTVVDTLALSRLLAGTAAVAIGAVAIAAAGGAAVWLFAILTLPMSLGIMASSSQDSLMIACGALAGAMMVRLCRWPDERRRKLLVVLATALILVGTARIPNGMLALMPLALVNVRLRWRLLASAAVAACVLAWAMFTSAHALVNFGDQFDANPPAQITWLLTHPLRIVPLAWNTLALYWPYYIDQFVGQLGWVDTFLPRPYYHAAPVMLGIAIAAAMFGLRGARISTASYVIIAAGVFLAVAGVFAAQYVAANKVGREVIEGVQGRHMLPLALAAAALLPALGETRLARLHKPLVLLVAAFPIVSLAVVMRAVVLRYYLG